MNQTKDIIKPVNSQDDLTSWNAGVFINSTVKPANIESSLVGIC